MSKRFKIFILSWLLIFLSSNGLRGQQNVNVLNSYKVIELLPLFYDNGSIDEWGIYETVVDKLESCGLKVENFLEHRNSEIDSIPSCSLLYGIIEHTRYTVTIELRNCEQQVVYRSQGLLPSMGSYRQRYKKATIDALNDFNSYRYVFDANNDFAAKMEAKKPKIETIVLSEDSIKQRLSQPDVEDLEGIYKIIKGDGTGYYKIAVLKYADVFKAIVLDSDVKDWKPGEVKALLEATSVENILSVKWYNNEKEPQEIFAYLEGQSILVMDFGENSEKKSEEIRFLKVFPTVYQKKTVKADSSTEVLATGTGFFITKDGLLATNSHVIEGANRIEAVVLNDTISVVYNLKLVLTDKNNDVAILKIDDEKFKMLNELPYGISDGAEVGSEVFTIGYPLNSIMGSNYKVSNGIISSNTGINDDIRYYQISVPLQPGNSGGPLFNSEGNIIGITSARLNEEAVGTNVQNVNYAVKSNYLNSLIGMLPNQGKIPSIIVLKDLDLMEQIKILKSYVCLIRIY